MEMKPVSDAVKEFFQGVEKASNTLDLELIRSQYNDSFVFANPSGPRVIAVEQLLAALPQRQGFFRSLGHKSTRVESLDETRLDEHYTMVRAHFIFQFEKAMTPPVEMQVDSIYILHIQNGSAKIVTHIEHEDLRAAMQTRGLLPGTTAGT